MIRKILEVHRDICIIRNGQLKTIKRFIDVQRYIRVMKKGG